MMLRLFKRTKLIKWEVELLTKVLKNITGNYNELISQVQEGLFRGVLTEISDIPGYVAFTYNNIIAKKYENKKEPGFILSNIKIHDLKSSVFLNYSIYVSNGMINGYSIDGPKKIKIDINNIDLSFAKKIHQTKTNDEILLKILSPVEIKLINFSNVFKVELDGKEIYNIKDLEDGDFIGIDVDKNIYKVTHDPYDLKILNTSLENIL